MTFKSIHFATTTTLEKIPNSEPVAVTRITATYPDGSSIYKDFVNATVSDLDHWKFQLIADFNVSFAGFQWPVLSRV